MWSASLRESAVPAIREQSKGSQAKHPGRPRKFSVLWEEGPDGARSRFEVQIPPVGAVADEHEQAILGPGRLQDRLVLTSSNLHREETQTASMRLQSQICGLA